MARGPNHLPRTVLRSRLMEVDPRQGEGIFILLLILETAMIGVFIALDLFLFYFFWEATLIPMALIIGIFGHQRRVYAAVKFFSTR